VRDRIDIAWAFEAADKSQPTVQVPESSTVMADAVASHGFALGTSFAACPHTARVSPAAMFYFFQKAQQFLQCEIRTTDTPETFAIVITEPNGTERSQYVIGSGEVSRAWQQVQADLVAAGWWGPYGRD
jgi:hypothetical protein